MLTPDFTLDQTLDKVILKVQIKYIKTQDIQVDLNDQEVRVYANPYFLFLTFPMSLEESEPHSYDISRGILTLEFKKAVEEYMSDLELKLILKNKSRVYSKPVIHDLSLENSVSQSSTDQRSCLGPRYGFNQEYSGIGRELSVISHEILEISDIDSVFSDFKQEYHHKISLKFDMDYYLQDLKDGIYPEILQFKSEFQNLLLLKQDKGESLILTSQDLKDLAEIPRKEYFIQETESLYLRLVDIMFSYSYNYLLNCGEENSESYWNLVKVSPTLSAFLSFTDLAQVVQTSVKASLCWPLLRNWEFSLKVLKHTTIIFKLGKKGIVKALLDMKRILQGDERTFTICQIYIIDYLSWTQTCASDKTISNLASLLNHFSLDKSDISFNGVSLLEMECSL